MVSEKSIEQKLRTETKKMGGWAVKFSSPGLDGMPDRLVLFPGGKLGFVELKAPGKKMRPLQEKRKRILEELGFLVFCVDSKESHAMIGKYRKAAMKELDFLYELRDKQTEAFILG